MMLIATSVDTTSVVDYLIAFLYNNFIDEGLIVIVACFVVGNIIKTSCPKVSNQLIVPIVSITGIAITLATSYPYEGSIVTYIIKGMVLGWSSTGFYELLRALIKLKILKVPGIDLNAILDFISNDTNDNKTNKEDNSDTDKQ
jgi:hypothetical protein